MADDNNQAPEGEAAVPAAAPEIEASADAGSPIGAGSAPPEGRRERGARGGRGGGGGGC